MKRRGSNFGLAVLGGAAVFAAGMAVSLALVPHDHAVTIHLIIANSIAALIGVIVSLALQLRHEEQHFRFAMEKAAIMTELNHNVRNAVFPLFLAVQQSADAESDRLANESMARLNIALRDAAVDAYSGKVNYSEESPGRAAVA